MASQTLNTHALSLVPRHESRVESAAPATVPDDGLGCMRGLAFAMLFNFILGLAGLGVWTLIHHLIR